MQQQVYIRMIEAYELDFSRFDSHIAILSHFVTVTISGIAAPMQRDTAVCIGASGAPAGSWRKARRGLRRFVDRKMSIARGLSSCKRASRSGSWICGIDGPPRPTGTPNSRE